MANRSYRRQWRSGTSVAHRPPEGRAGHLAGGKETDSTGQFRVPGGQCAETGRRIARNVEEWWPERTHGEHAVEGVMADRRISNRLKGNVMSMCHTSMPVRNGNLGSDRTTTRKAASVRKQLGPKNTHPSCQYSTTGFHTPV